MWRLVHYFDLHFFEPARLLTASGVLLELAAPFLEHVMNRGLQNSIGQVLLMTVKHYCGLPRTLVVSERVLAHVVNLLAHGREQRNAILRGIVSALAPERLVVAQATEMLLARFLDVTIFL